MGAPELDEYSRKLCLCGGQGRSVRPRGCPSPESLVTHQLLPMLLSASLEGCRRADKGRLMQGSAYQADVPQ
eukprot:38337-Chlamydomonas_euryale.AAC.4